MFTIPPVDDVVAAALAEDLGVPAARLLDPSLAGPDVLERDVTSCAVLPPDARFAGRVTARSEGVVAGLSVAARVWAMLAEAAGLTEAVDVFPLVAEGAEVARGTVVAEVDGDARVVLGAERTALNALMTLSGVATAARRWRNAAGPALTVADTRKTWPGLRALSKYAVRVGGASNHREGLFDMVLVKDNHARHAGGIAAAVAKARVAHPHLEVEVEADSVAQAVEAARAGADWVLLDNMDDRQLAEAVRAVREAAAEIGRLVRTEASGGLQLERLPALAETGVDRVSTSAVTLAPPVDFGLDEAEP